MTVVSQMALYSSRSVSDSAVLLRWCQLYAGSFIFTEHCIVENWPHVYLSKNGYIAPLQAITVVTWRNTCNVIGGNVFTSFTPTTYTKCQSFNQQLESSYYKQNTCWVLLCTVYMNQTVFIRIMLQQYLSHSVLFTYFFTYKFV